jgi:hypothetical protein
MFDVEWSLTAWIFYHCDLFVGQVGQSTLSGKEDTVLKGLDATRRNIDDFLAYFPKSDVEKVFAQVSDENALNVKEFDPSLGSPLNMAPL